MMGSGMNRKCYLCGGTEKEIIHKGVRGNADIDVYRCLNCGLVYLSDFISNTNDFYRESEMRKNEDDKDDLRKIRINAQSDDERRYAYTKALVANKTLLDFGCGAGGYLQNTVQAAQKVYGIELEKRMSNALNAEGIKCFESIDIAEKELREKIDIITMWHVLEHLEDPITMLKRLSELLKPDGRIIIEVPNADDALFSIYNCEAFADFSYWECHLYLYNNETLKRVIERANLRMCFQTQIQRYPLANHLYWLTNKKPGGHEKWFMLTENKELDKEYGKLLASIGSADTLIAECKK